MRTLSNVVSLVAVAKLDGLVSARRGTRGDGGTEATY